METIILRNDSVKKGYVENQGFDGLFWRGDYWDEKGFHHFVTYENNAWRE